MEYRITREQCQAQIDKYGNVCAGCGGSIQPFDTVDNSGAPTFWAGCETCSCFENGVPRLVHDIAKLMVVDYRHRAYTYEREPENDKPEYSSWLRSQIRGTTHTVALMLHIQQSLGASQ